jgi:hypothetical protein
VTGILEATAAVDAQGTYDAVWKAKKSKKKTRQTLYQDDPSLSNADARKKDDVGSGCWPASPT